MKSEKYPPPFRALDGDKQINKLFMDNGGSLRKSNVPRQGVKSFGASP
jgi:hypothetical protein